MVETLERVESGLMQRYNVPMEEAAAEVLLGRKWEASMAKSWLSTAELAVMMPLESSEVTVCLSDEEGLWQDL